MTEFNLEKTKIKIRIEKKQKILFMNRQDTSQINQGTYYYKFLLNLCKVNILQKKVATAMVTTRHINNQYLCCNLLYQVYLLAEHQIAYCHQIQYHIPYSKNIHRHNILQIDMQCYLSHNLQY